MAQLVLAEAGRQVGNFLLPNGLSALGLSIGGAELGAALGAVAGRAIDASLSGPVGETGRISGLSLLESREGAGIPRVFGRYRIGGQVIWSTHLKERKRDRQVGGKGGPSITEYSYTISFAVGLCEGEVTSLDRVWANGEPVSLSGLTWRLYRGTEDQMSDPLIEASEGAAPAYRGLAYIVFEDFPLDDYGARLPQLSFEVTRPVTGRKRSLRDVVTSVNLIPASGEWVYSPDLIRRIEYPGWETALNRNSGSGETDVIRALDQLQADLPRVRSVNLTLAWFGDDLRCGVCTVRPGVETRDQINLPRDWSVGGTDRSSARLISRDEAGRPYYGGTPDDTSVLRLMEDLSLRGLAVTLSPFLLMDIPPDNVLPDIDGNGYQPAFPWRGRVSSAEDKSAQTRADVDAFFGAARAGDFRLEGERVVYGGPSEWGYRRFVLHLAMLGKLAGNLEAFLLGSELRGLSRLRDEAGAYPAVEQMISLAAEVRTILGPDVKISYAADWTEYGAYTPDDGSGDVLFPLDDLWADNEIDFIGLDWYAPLSDWREGDHLDGADYDDLKDPAYLAANIEGGEGYDWYYASPADRDSQTRTPIEDESNGEDWIFRVKDIRSWWASDHFERPGGSRKASPTRWQPDSKPVRFVEIGCGAIDKGTNAPNVFVDPKSSETGFPYYSDGTRDDSVQSAAIMALYDYWAEGGDNNPVSSVYSAPMVDAQAMSVWCYDARPFPAFPGRGDIWSDAENWARGHWLNGRLSTSQLGAIIEDVCGDQEISIDVSAVTGAVPGYASSGLSTLRELIEPLAFSFALNCRQTEDGLQFFNRDDHPAGAVTQSDFAVTRDERTALIERRSLTDHDLKGVRVTVSDPDNAYQPLSVFVGEAPEGDRDLHLRLPMAFNDDAAQALTEAVFSRINSERESFSLMLSPGRPDIRVGDLMDCEGLDGPVRVRVLDEKGVRQLELGSIGAVFSGSQDTIASGTPPAHVPLPDMVVLDLPSLPGSEDDIRPLVGAFSYPWPGRVAVFAGPSEAALTSRTSLSQAAMIGRLTNTLPAGPGDRFRPGVQIDVRFPQADLSSRSRQDVLNGASLIAVETVEGWMLSGFERAEQLSEDIWRLSSLLTGLSGTEDLSQLGADPGARIVLIDEALARADVSHHELGAELIWQGQGAGSEGETGQYSLTLAGRARHPFRPGHLKAMRHANGDIQLGWTRRVRHSGDRWDTPDVPILDVPLTFRIDVLAGETLMRTEEVTNTGWIYTAAEQANDGTSVSALTFRVAQLSQGYGDGVPAECVTSPP